MKELKAKDIRKMNDEEKMKKLKDLRSELLHENGVASMGGAPHNPGKIGSLKRQIARLNTVIGEGKHE